MENYDIVIVGAGPAGSTLARELPKNLKVLLIDKRALNAKPTKLIKNCGGLISPDAQKALASFDLSIPKDILVTPQMFYVKTIDFDNNMVQNYQRYYINVNRELFDRWLVKLIGTHVEKSFKTRFKNAVKIKDKHHITVVKNGKTKKICCKLLIGADGANSRVKQKIIGTLKNEPKRYISTQEWFKIDSKNSYVAMFDSQISDFYSWIIPKEEYLIFGTAIKEGADIAKYHNLQKDKLKEYGYNLENAIKKEGCYLLRPKSSKDICLGKDKVALIGEASGLISPTSAEGISYAMLSGYELAVAIEQDFDNFLKVYKKRVNYLKKNIDLKLKKYPFMYNKRLRKIILSLGIGSLSTRGLSLKSTRYKEII
jgi:flavin-dependent dehydrogenase